MENILSPAQADKPDTEPMTPVQPEKAPEAVARPWMEKLSDPALKSSKSLSKFTSEEALAKSYIELEGKLGKSVSMPGQDASPEDWAKFYERVGRKIPKSADEYAIDRGKADDALVSSFKKSALEAGLSSDEAGKVFKGVLQYLDSSKAAQSESYTSRMKEADVLLRKEYGPQYESKLKDARSAFDMLFDDQTRADIAESGLANNPRFIKVLAELGPQLNGDYFLRASGKEAPKADPLAWMDKKYGSGSAR